MIGVNSLRGLLLAISLIALGLGAHAQPIPLTADFAAEGVSSYLSSVPTPEEVLGFTIGERHTRPDEVVRYFEAVAAASDRVTFGEHARSHEGRRLVHAVVAAPGTDLEAVRVANHALSEWPERVTPSQMASMPVVAYMGYSVHGDEASGTEAAILLLYHLAAGQGSAVEQVLQNLVVIIDPMLNPDGRARFVNWVNSNRSGASEFASLDGQDREHSQAWPRGRTNRYLFDLNRDWLPLVHPESRGRMELWHDWRPQVSTDFHEMGGNATYFFQPGIPSRNNPRTPERNYELTQKIAEHHARALDRVGQLYYTRESFDDYYLGKGSSYPDVQGSVGILFEQASSRALVAETIHGQLDYGTTVRNQFATSLSTLAGAVEHRSELLSFMRETYLGAADFARRSRVAAWIIDVARDSRLADEFIDVLARHRIDSYDLVETVSVDGHRFEPGSSFVVPVNQPQARFVKAVMERVHTFTDSLFYDVSTWPLPLAYGLPHAELERTPRLGYQLDGWTPAGRLYGGHGQIAYLLPWESSAAPSVLYRLQRMRVRARLMREPFEAVGAGWSRTFDRGAVVIPVAGSGVDAAALRSVIDDAVSSGLDIYSASTGLSVSGPDLGGASSRVLTAPRVAILAGEGTHVLGVGEVWHYLAERVGMPVSLLDLHAVRTADLSRYNRIIVAGNLTGRSAGAAVEPLREWVRAGGVLVLSGAAMGWGVRTELLELEARTTESDTLDLAYADVVPVRGAEVIGGSVFEVGLDPTHPIAFGYRGPLAVFKQGVQAFDPSAVPGSTVGVYSEEPRLSGYVSATNLERISGGSAVVAQRQGSGAVVAFDFAPAFRGFWRGTERLLANAVFFGESF